LTLIYINEYISIEVDDPVGSIGVQIFGGYFGIVGVSIFKEDGLLLAPSKTTAYVSL